MAAHALAPRGIGPISAGFAVLDLGCGSEDPADVEIAKRHKVTGVDISQAQIDLARRNVPSGTFLHADSGAIDFPPAAFDAAVSFYTLEHILRAEHAAILQRICGWLRPGGLLLISMEAGEYDNVEGTWLGVPMFLSCYDPDTMLRLVEDAGIVLSTAEFQRGCAGPRRTCAPCARTHGSVRRSQRQATTSACRRSTA
jgi:SAM-dependent methyltransferase